MKEIEFKDHEDAYQKVINFSSQRKADLCVTIEYPDKSAFFMLKDTQVMDLFDFLLAHINRENKT
jgi:hypothetical protein